MIKSRFRGFVAACLAGACLPAAGCFAASSGGPSGNVTFDSGDIDGFGSDSALPEESGVDAAPDVVADVGADAGPDSSSILDASRSDASDSAAPADSGSAGDASDAASPTHALVRFANLVSNVGTGVDFCVAPTGSPFTTPYMNAQGVSAGLAYKDVSEYAALAPASGFVVRVVAAGSNGCATALASDVTVGPSTSSPTTVTFTGLVPGADGGAPPQLTGLSDDAASTSPSGIRFRAVHAAPSLGSADFEIGVSPYVQAIQTAVPYGATFAPSTVASGAPTPDAQGYVVPSYGTAQVTLLLSGVETTSFYVGNNGVSTASVTAFLVGAVGSATDPIGFVDCDELAAPTAHLSSCPFNSAAPVTMPMRFFHGAPDQGAIDVCAAIGPASTPYSTRLISAAGNMGGATFLQLTGDLTSIPANTDFHIAFTPVGQPCATSAFVVSGSSLRLHELTAGLLETYGTGTGYLGYFFETQLAPNANSVALDFGSLAQQTAGGQIVDLSAMVNGMGTVPLYSMVGGANYGSEQLSLPGTFTFLVTDSSSMTTLYDKGGFVMNAGATYFLWWLNQGSATTGTLAQCPLDQRTASALVSCPN